MSGAERIHVSVVDGSCDPESKEYPYMIMRHTHNIPQTIMIIEKRSSLLDDWQLP